MSLKGDDADESPSPFLLEGTWGLYPLVFFVDTFGKHGVIFIHDGPCCYRCFSNGAIFPDYSYESMDL